MIDLLGQPMTAALLGAVGGILLGLAARLGRFCTLGAIEDALYGGSDTRLRMWGLAIGVAIVGTFGLAAAGYINLDNAFYFSVAFSWPAAIVGGLLFGYGMALSGTCGFGAGPFAYVRAALFPRVADTGTPDGIAHVVAQMTGVPLVIAGLFIGVLIIGAMLSAADFRRNRSAIIWGAIVGLAIVTGWAGTAWIAQNGFAPQVLISHTYAAPVGETLLYAMQGSARPLSFGVGSVAGVWIGAFIGSLWKGHFRWEACEDPRELRRQIIGAAIMGAGAVIAMGCTVGQGLSAASTLAFSAPVTLIAIFAGAALGLRQLIVGFGGERV